MNLQTGIAQLQSGSGNPSQVEVCSRCHARRAPITRQYRHGKPVLDSYRVAFLEAGLYFADGQIQDEVYVYGSFLQSPMYAAGVTCSDCHQPHSLKLRAPGNALCGQCHLPARFDTPDHHHHGGDAGCVDCHMTGRTYMGVDYRRDHSFRVPRPDVSARIGSPDACTQCHTDQDSAWAAASIRQWYPEGRHTQPHFGDSLHAARTGGINAGGRIVKLALDATQAGIVRGTALSLLGGYLHAGLLEGLSLAIRDDDPWVRLGGLQALEAVPTNYRLPLAAHLLTDGIRAVRIEAARMIAAVPPQVLGPNESSAMDKALREYIDAQLARADRPDSHLNLGNLALARGEAAPAEAAFLTALEIEPTNVPARVNLSDVYRAMQRDDLALAVIEAGLELLPDEPVFHQVRGLILVRLGRSDEAVAVLEHARRLAPEHPHYWYVHAVALHSTGRESQAVELLDEALIRFPNDREMLMGALSFARQAGDENQAMQYLQRLDQLDPGHPGLAQLRAELQSGGE